MDNNVRPYIAEEDDVIDLRELVLYVLRKWRILVALGVIGMLLGGCFGLLKPERTLEDLDLDTIQVKEVEQYARYQQMYEDQLAWEQESVLLNLDPNHTYYANKTYLMRVNETDLPIIGEMYRSILKNNQVYDELIQVSGIDCTLRAMKQLVQIGFSKLEEEDEPILLLAKQRRSVEVSISTIAPDEESCRNMLTYLDELVEEMNAQVSTNYDVMSCEVLTNNYDCGYVSNVATARNDSTETLSTYVTKISTLKKTLTEDDLIYYADTYLDETTEEEEEGSLSWLKWAIVIGVVFGFLGVCVYIVLYLLDGHIKTGDELLAYGLHPFAVLAEKRNQKKRNPIDRLLYPKKRTNDTAYLVETLRTLGLGKIMLCGNMEDGEVASLLSEIREMDGGLLTGMLLSVDGAAQRIASEADGVVLLVHLYQTRREELEQEIRICQKIGQTVLGVAIIG